MILKHSIPLKKYSNYKIGGIAEYFFEFKSREELIQALQDYKEIDPMLKNVFILGKGTNILFGDGDYKGLILKNSVNFIERAGETVNVGSGVLMDELLAFAIQNNLSGLEWAGGLPGTVGGAVRGNAGAFGGETKDNILEVESMDIHTLQNKKRNKNECKFGYRQSVFKDGIGKEEVILSAKFKLKKGDGEIIKKSTQEKIDYRIDRHPRNYPNIGSTFKNIPVEKVGDKVLEEFKSSIKQDPFPVLPAAKLIAMSGLVGEVAGGAQISTKHPNFIVNIKNAKAMDVISLIGIIKKRIKAKYQVTLQEEITIV